MRRSAKPQQRTGREAAPFSGLRFAIYARKSTEDARHEDHRSTARQIAQATRYVEARGGSVLTEHAYVDEDISGAEFKNRPGLARLLNAVENGKPFTALVMSDRDRLGREQIEGAYILKRITDAGVRVWYYLEDREATLDSPIDKMVSNLGFFAAEMERVNARRRNRDKAEAQARAGHVTGGVVFGYTNVKMKGDRPAAPDETHDYVVRRINEEEAKAVRGMFRMYLDGYGLTGIAKCLNGAPAYRAEGRKYFGGQRVASPAIGTGSWAPTCVREILRRPLYKGVIVWGKTTRLDKGGRAGVQVKADRPLIETPVPALKIVEPAVWEAVRRRLKSVGEAYLRDPHGRLQGKPDRPDLRNEGGYLLSGLGRCAVCGWNMVAFGGEARRYGCGHYVKRGPTVCPNNLAQSVALVDAAVLTTLEQEVMIPERFAYVLRRAIEMTRDRLKAEPDRLPGLRKERADLERRIKKWVDAIGDGRAAAALVQEIERAEQRIKAIDAEIARLEAAPGLTAGDVQRMEREAAGELARFTALLKGNVPRARQALKKLLVDRMVFTPVPATHGKGVYRFRGELSYGAVIGATACVVSPAGFEPAFRP